MIMNTLSVLVTVNLTLPTVNLISKIVFLHYDFTNSGISIFNFQHSKMNKTVLCYCVSEV